VLFSYHPHLGAIGVTVTPEEHAGSLVLVFDDAGDELPDEGCLVRALAAVADDEPLPKLAAMLPARPFRWAQWLSGIGPPLADGGRHMLPAQTTAERLVQWLAKL